MFNFLFTQGDIAQAGVFAQLAVKTDRYNARALVNLGVVLVEKGEPERAKEMFLEAIGESPRRAALNRINKMIELRPLSPPN